MIPHLVYHQLVILALLWLCVMRPHRSIFLSVLPPPPAACLDRATPCHALLRATLATSGCRHVMLGTP